MLCGLGLAGGYRFLTVVRVVRGRIVDYCEVACFGNVLEGFGVCAPDIPVKVACCQACDVEIGKGVILG